MGTSCRLAGLWIDRARVYAIHLEFNLPQRHEEAVPKLVRRAPHVEFAVFVITVDLAAKLEVMLAVRNEDHVREVKNLLVEKLRVAVVTTKVHFARTKIYLLHTR